MPQSYFLNTAGTSSVQIPSDVFSMTILMYGGSGGGEHIDNNGTSRQGGNGGDTTFLGFSAGKGEGGGRGSKNAVGSGGTATDGGNWNFYGGSVTLLDGSDGQVPDGNTVIITTAEVFNRQNINRYKNTNTASTYFGDRFTSNVAPSNTDWAFEKTLGSVFLNQAENTNSVIDDNDNDLSQSLRPFRDMGYAYTSQSQIPAGLSTSPIYLFERTHGTITDKSFGTSSTELTNLTAQTATVTNNRSSVTYTGLSGFTISITRYIAPGISGTEGHPVGSLKYVVDITGLINPNMTVSVIDNSTRASGLSDPNNSIEVAPSNPVLDSSNDNRYEISFQMDNSQGSGKQATFVRSFALTMREGDYTLVTPNVVFYIPDEDLTVTTETETTVGSVTSPAGGEGAAIISVNGKDGGDGANDQVVYYSSMNHVFNNTTNQNITSDSSPDLSVTTENQSAADGISCTPSSSKKRYGIRFNSPYDNNQYSYTLNSFSNQTAGGGTSGSFTSAGQTDKIATGIKQYFCRSGSNTYIRSFTFTTQGKKSTLRGSGGGGSAFVRAFLDRETLEAHPTYSIGETYNVVVGDGGNKGAGPTNPQGQNVAYSRSQNGIKGSVEIEFIIQAGAQLKDGDTNNTGTTQLLSGEILTLTWITSGDNLDGTFLQQDGVTIGEVLNNSSIEVSPTETTTYTIFTSGLGGSATSDLIVEVFQPPTLTVSFPLAVDWGEDFDLDVETNYADAAVTATYVATYFDGTTETIVVNGAPNSSASIEEDLEQNLGPEINWSPLGPSSIAVVVSISGVGGIVTDNATITVNIDRLPDLFNIPDSKDIFPSDQVIAPEPDVNLTDPILITDIDIPVEIKSSHEIQVRFDDDDPNIETNWKNVREL